MLLHSNIINKQIRNQDCIFLFSSYCINNNCLIEINEMYMFCTVLKNIVIL